MGTRTISDTAYREENRDNFRVYWHCYLYQAIGVWIKKYDLTHPLSQIPGYATACYSLLSNFPSSKTIGTQRHRTVRDDYCWVSRSFTSFIISASVFFSAHFNTANYSSITPSFRFGGLPVWSKSSMLCRHFHHFRNFRTQNCLTFNEFNMNTCIELLIGQLNFITISFCSLVNSLPTVPTAVQSLRLSTFLTKWRHKQRNTSYILKY